jgi:CDP-4-dehydro-6-deoxyglucose reductase, E3
MTTIRFNGNQYQLSCYESVLDCLLRNGIAIPYACKAGMCQACLVRAVDCIPTQESAKWIKEDLRARGFTLACQWVPQGDVQVELPSIEAFAVASNIDSLDLLNNRVMRVRLTPESTGTIFPCRPGQYLNVANPEGITRSYSLANNYEIDGFMELHVAATTFGAFTHWLFNQAAPGMRLHIRSTGGDCCYNARENKDHPILLAGTGTGLAPLYGIASDALRQKHSGTIHLFHGARHPADLYYVKELEALSLEHSNFHYHPCVLEPDISMPAACQTGSLETIVESVIERAETVSIHAYLCGAPNFVFNLRKRLYLQGLRPSHLHCDPFTERDLTPGSTG